MMHFAGDIKLFFIVSRRGQVDGTFACRAGSTRSNLTAAQISNPVQPALCCLHEGCLEGESAVYTYSVYPYWQM